MKSYKKCWDCKQDIFDNDEANVCIECGGMSGRVNSFITGMDDLYLSYIFWITAILGIIYLTF